MRIYWYAPFNNASELLLAAELGRSHDLVVQSLETRLGRRPEGDPATCTMVRDLPDSAGDDGGRRTRSRRAAIAVARARARQKVVGAGTFDMVHLHTYNPFTDPAAIAWLRRSAPVVLSVHNVRPHDQRFGNVPIEGTVLRAGYAQADHIVVAHRLLAEQLHEDFRIAPERVSVVPLAIVPPAIPAGAPPEEASFLLFFGTLRHNKGIEILLDAMRIVADPSVRLHIAGRGPGDLEALVGAASADPRITAEVGYVEPERQDELFRGASAVLLPYTSFDAQSGVLRDAYAYGRPVIASDVGALGAEVAEHGSGTLVPPADASALASAIETMWTDGTARRRLAMAAASVAAERSVAASVGHLSAAYEAVASTPRRAG